MKHKAYSSSERFEKRSEPLAAGVQTYTYDQVYGKSQFAFASHQLIHLGPRVSAVDRETLQATVTFTHASAEKAILGKHILILYLIPVKGTNQYI